MLKLLAVLRTLAALVVGFLMLRASPMWADPRLTCDEQRLYYYRSAGGLLFASGVAVAWIAVEAVVTWIRAFRKAKKAAVTTPAGPAAV